MDNSCVFQWKLVQVHVHSRIFLYAVNVLVVLQSIFNEKFRYNKYYTFENLTKIQLA